MNKEKKIEEMAKAVCHLDRTCDECMTSFECKAMLYAKRFYNAGYRKASDVAEEIFAEIDEIINKPFIVGFNLLAPLKQALGEYDNGIRRDLLYYIAKLKKKHTTKSEDTE